MKRGRMSTLAQTLGIGLLALLAAPSMALAAGGGHGEEHAINWTQVIASIFNFTVYLSLVVYFVRKPLAAFFESRRAAMVGAMEESKRAQESAEATLAETMTKLQAFDAERAKIIEDFRQLGEQERQRIVNQAQAEAAKIRRDAEVSVQMETRRAKAQLERQMAEMAVQMAQTEVKRRLTPLTHAKLIDAGIESLSSSGRQ